MMIRRMRETEPLRIAELAAGCGLLGLTVCPGKQSDSLYGPPLQRDLDRDLERIQAWGASHLITLLEARELVELKVPDLGAAVEAKGIRWHHLPTPDAQAPGAGVSGVESCLSEEVRCCLKNQERVLIHCRGGLVRASRLAAVILIKLGVGVEEAVRRVRKARSAVIDLEQEAYMRRN